MGSLAPTACQDSLRGKEAVNIFGFGLFTHENHAFTSPPPLLSPIGIEDSNAHCYSREMREALLQWAFQ